MGRAQRVRAGDQNGGEGPQGRQGQRRRLGGGRHQPPPCDALETVGFGAGAALVGEAGAGAAEGGASVADLDGAAVGIGLA